MNGEELPVVFTYHARERMREAQMSTGKALFGICNAIPEKPPDWSWKAHKYHGNHGTKYLRFGPVIYTGKRVLDKRSGEPIFLVFTVTDQRVTLKEYNE